MEKISTMNTRKLLSDNNILSRDDKVIQNHDNFSDLKLINSNECTVGDILEIPDLDEFIDCDKYFTIEATFVSKKLPILEELVSSIIKTNFLFITTEVYEFKNLCNIVQPIQWTGFKTWIC